MRHIFSSLVFRLGSWQASKVRYLPYPHKQNASSWRELECTNLQQSPNNSSSCLNWSVLCEVTILCKPSLIRGTNEFGGCIFCLGETIFGELGVLQQAAGWSSLIVMFHLLQLGNGVNVRLIVSLCGSCARALAKVQNVHFVLIVEFMGVQLWRELKRRTVRKLRY